MKSRTASGALLVTLSAVATACSADVSGSDQTSKRALDVGSASQALEDGLDARRSLAVTDDPILARFSLERVLTQLAKQSGVRSATALSLFHQWWDTQNPAPGLGLGAHCDDKVDPVMGTVLNGYPYLCRPAPAEGVQAACDPFAAESACAYVPIGLFNRFDLAPEDGSNCGEHRIVYGKKSGILDATDRATLIFEATMPNPHPEQGLQGCRPLVDTWAGLTTEDDIEARADALEQLYFVGIPEFPPVVAIDHYGDNFTGVGQIRINQLSHATTGWSLREFKLRRTCLGSTMSMPGRPICNAIRFVPVTDKTNAFGGLFDPASTHPSAAAFVKYFPSQVKTLAGATVPDISLSVPDLFDTGQSQASGTTAAEMKYLDQLTTSPSALRDGIQTKLTSVASTLSPDDIVLRAQANTCAGCHRLNNNVGIGGGLVWPASLGFVHVSDRDTEVVDGVTRHPLSPALIDVFLPHRKEVVEGFLKGDPAPTRGPKVSISGGSTHG